MEQNQYGFFTGKPGEYVLTEIPAVGSYWYYYGNEKITVRVDQNGIDLCQADAPAGIALLKRERYGRSPWLVYIQAGDRTVNNFDLFAAKSIRIEFRPEKAVYRLEFGEFSVETLLFVPPGECRAVMSTRIVNRTERSLKVAVMPCVIPYVNDLCMAPWDKPEWYTKTSAATKGRPAFRTDRYSVNGKREERRYAHCLFDKGAKETCVSFEKVNTATRGFTRADCCFPKGEKENELFAFEQIYAAVYRRNIAAGASACYTQVLAMSHEEETVSADCAVSEKYFRKAARGAACSLCKKKTAELFKVNRVRTKDKDFDLFANTFLPLELSWVSRMDRGWPTGMRGTRDASNDFSGFLSYDAEKCRQILLHLLSCQREDGWFPRQVPFGQSGKFDMRPFVDAGCFVLEFAYRYLTYSKDRALTDIRLPYLGGKKSGSVLEHLILAADYFLMPENIGEHGICKIRGGDWLDCICSAGMEGRGETVMVTCQLILAIDYLCKILRWCGKHTERIAGYLEWCARLKERVNACAFNEKGFYNGVFTDRGEWIFSSRDPDGACRPYVPTNSYAILCGAADGKEERVLENLRELRCEYGYKLFSPAMGERRIEGIGKMGTGDLLPGFSENGNPYNQGGQCFLIRALAKSGDYAMLDDVLRFALPYDQGRHPALRVCAAPYAVVNVYHGVPMFPGRAGFSFLTGSVAMLERAVYNWIFGIDLQFDGICIAPCVPASLADASVVYRMQKKELSLRFHGYGNAVVKANVGRVSDGKLFVNEGEIAGKNIHVYLNAGFKNKTDRK